MANIGWHYGEHFEIGSEGMGPSYWMAKSYVAHHFIIHIDTYVVTCIVLVIIHFCYLIQISTRGMIAFEDYSIHTHDVNFILLPLTGLGLIIFIVILRNLNLSDRNR